MKFIRYFRLIVLFIGTSISTQLEYRVNFIVYLMASALNISGSLLVLFVLTSDGRPLGGWSYRGSAVVLGYFTIIQGFVAIILQPNLSKISEAVRTGQLDFTLLKPIDAQFVASFRNINLFRMTDVIAGTCLIIWAVSGITTFSFANLITSLLLLLCSFVIIYSIWLMLMTTAFWFVKVENITEIFNSLFKVGQFPITAFPNWMRFVFTFIIPIAFTTTVPAEALIGQSQIETALISLCVALILLLASRALWLRALHFYSSASS